MTTEERTDALEEELASGPPPGFRHSASFGKRQEYVAIARLLEEGLDVYMTLVDDQGIDCIIRKDATTFYDVQIKARSRYCKPQQAGTFPLLYIPDPRPNYFFVFYSEQAKMHWIIPSMDIVGVGGQKGLANQLKSGKNKGKYRVDLTSMKGGKPNPRPKFSKYENALDLLK